MSHFDGLAGLDSMVLHINTHSNQSPTLSDPVITLDGESYVLVPGKKRKLEQARRLPLADKTPSLNTNGSPALDTVVHRKPNISISVYQDNVIQPRPVTSGLSGSPSFKPLPPMPDCSPLRTSFLDFSFRSNAPFPESQSKHTTPTIHSSVLPQHNRTSLVQDQPNIVNSTAQKIHDEPFPIPAFQHPNSPYVPWAPPVRRRILRPFAPGSHVSLFSGCNSRPVSRSGARAPEPADTPEPIRRLSPASKGWKQFRQAISHGVTRIATHLSILKQAFPDKTPMSPSSHIIDTRSVSQNDTYFIANYPPSPISPLAVLTGRAFTPSMVSLSSSDSITLAAWLAARQRASLEQQDYDPGSLMTLDEYERMGSWLDLSGDEKLRGKWVCGVPGCDIHARHMLMHGGQVTTLDFSAKENMTSGPSKGMRILRPASAALGDCSLLSEGLSDRRQRETSMPGG